MAPRTPRFQGRMGLTEPIWALRRRRGVGGPPVSDQWLTGGFGLDGLDGPSFARFRVRARAQYPQKQKNLFSRVCWKTKPVKPVKPKCGCNALNRLDCRKTEASDFQAQYDAVKPIRPKSRGAIINMRGRDEQKAQHVGF